VTGKSNSIKNTSLFLPILLVPPSSNWILSFSIPLCLSPYYLFLSYFIIISLDLFIIFLMKREIKIKRERERDRDEQERCREIGKERIQVHLSILCCTNQTHYSQHIYWEECIKSLTLKATSLCIIWKLVLNMTIKIV
jgi:hypothetical protein